MTRELSLLFHVLVFVELMHVTTFLAAAEPKVPCYFIFGDSLVDSGNKNNLPGMKANYPPYGIDFPEGATGRFTNGRTVVDIIGRLLDFPKFIPPYRSAKDTEIITGVNYGSGGAGIAILEETVNLLDGIHMVEQLSNHKKIVTKISALQGNKTFTDEHLKKCIYLSNIGTSEYIHRYYYISEDDINFVIGEKLGPIYTKAEYGQLLVKEYSGHLKTLYNMGARKIVVFGLSQLGCTPFVKEKLETAACLKQLNDAVNIFNDKLTSLVTELNSDYQDARFTFINVTSILARRTDLPLLSASCCQKLTGSGGCQKDSSVCPVRTLTPYFDGYNPTEIVNGIIGLRAYALDFPTDTYPYDISKLVKL